MYVVFVHDAQHIREPLELAFRSIKNSELIDHYRYLILSSKSNQRHHPLLKPARVYSNVVVAAQGALWALLGVTLPREIHIRAV